MAFSDVSGFSGRSVSGLMALGSVAVARLASLPLRFGVAGGSVLASLLLRFVLRCRFGSGCSADSSLGLLLVRVWLRFRFVVASAVGSRLAPLRIRFRCAAGSGLDASRVRSACVRFAVVLQSDLGSKGAGAFAADRFAWKVFR